MYNTGSYEDNKRRNCVLLWLEIK